MQAIITKYLGPTNFRGSRIKASCQAGSIVVPWDDAKDPDDNHDMAARMLMHKLGWHWLMCRGALPSGAGNVYVNGKDIVR